MCAHFMSVVLRLSFAMEQMVLDILTLKVLVATIDALGHFETG